MRVFLSIIFSIGILFNANSQTTDQLTGKGLNISNPAFSIPYALNEPNFIFELPDKLQEISGLSLSPDGQQLCAINDEMGILFFINKEIGKVEKEIEFYSDGDYEGIEVVGEKVYIVKSTGTLYEVSNVQSDSLKCVKHKYKLKKNNDVEGLSYDKKTNSLLLVCKGQHCFEENSGAEDCWKKKAVYGINLETGKLDTEPRIMVQLQDVKDFLMKHSSPEELKLFKSNLKEEGNQIFKFNPSGLAIHPKTGNIYVVASKGKSLGILSPQGKILEIFKLNKKIHTQPEGIVFDEDGTLYISNEGKKDGKGTICKFKMN